MLIYAPSLLPCDVHTQRLGFVARLRRRTLASSLPCNETSYMRDFVVAINLSIPARALACYAVSMLLCFYVTLFLCYAVSMLLYFATAKQ